MARISCRGSGLSPTAGRSAGASGPRARTARSRRTTCRRRRSARPSADRRPSRPAKATAVVPGSSRSPPQRDLGGLHRHRQRGPAAQVTEVEAAGRVLGGEPDRLVRRRAARSRARAAAPAGCRRTGRPRCARPPRSAPASASASARATGRPRSAQQASCRPCVHTAKRGSSCRARPRLRPAARAPRSQSRTASRSGTTAVSAQAPARTAKTRAPGVGLDRPGRRTSSGRTRCAAACRWRAGPSAAGSRLSRKASEPQGPACSISR